MSFRKAIYRVYLFPLDLAFLIHHLSYVPKATRRLPPRSLSSDILTTMCYLTIWNQIFCKTLNYEPYLLTTYEECACNPTWNWKLILLVQHFVSCDITIGRTTSIILPHPSYFTPSTHQNEFLSINGRLADHAAYNFFWFGWRTNHVELSSKTICRVTCSLIVILAFIILILAYNAKAVISPLLGEILRSFS